MDKYRYRQNLTRKSSSSDVVCARRESPFIRGSIYKTNGSSASIASENRPHVPWIASGDSGEQHVSSFYPREWGVGERVANDEQIETCWQLCEKGVG